MFADLRRRPWTLAARARSLSELLLHLHEIEAPAALPAAGASDRVLHLDLHPQNVILSRSPGALRT
jgi:Ser/Thr protein kinase RdoA (MazF antagonist)